MFNPDLMTPSELCEYLGISRTTLTKWSKRSDFPRAVRPTQRTVFYRRSEIEAWLDRSKK